MIVTMLGVTWKIRSWKTGKVPFRPLFVYKSQGCVAQPDTKDTATEMAMMLFLRPFFIMFHHGKKNLFICVELDERVRTKVTSFFEDCDFLLSRGVLAGRN